MKFSAVKKKTFFPTSDLVQFGCDDSHNTHDDDGKGWEESVGVSVNIEVFFILLKNSWQQCDFIAWNVLIMITMGKFSFYNIWTRALEQERRNFTFSLREWSTKREHLKLELEMDDKEIKLQAMSSGEILSTRRRSLQPTQKILFPLQHGCGTTNESEREEVAVKAAESDVSVWRETP